MRKKISKKKANDFLRKWKSGAKIKIFYCGIVYMFSETDGYSLNIKGDFLEVRHPDGDLFDRLNLKTAEVYLYEEQSDGKN